MIGEVEPVVVLRVLDAVDAASAVAVQEQCEKLTSSLDAQAMVVLALSQAAVVSAAGVRALVELATDLGGRGVRTAFVCEHGQATRHTLQVVLAGTAWPVHSSVDRALVRRKGSGPMFVALTDVLMRAPTAGDELQRTVDAPLAIAETDAAQHGESRRVQFDAAPDVDGWDKHA